jgi:hypothetical protein
LALLYLTQSYSEVFASFKESLYSEHWQKLIKKFGGKNMDKPKAPPKNKPLQPYKGKVPQQILRGKEALEFRERMGLSSSSLIISNKLSKSPKA